MDIDLTYSGKLLTKDQVSSIPHKPTRLALYKCTFTPDALLPLRSKPQLQSLILWANTLKGLEFQHLGTLNLTQLNLVNNQIHDESVQHIVKLRRLTKLSLDSNKVANEGAQILSRCNRLEVLGLQRNQIGDIGAKELARMYQLRYLDLRWNRLTERAKKLVKVMMPNCPKFEV